MDFTFEFLRIVYLSILFVFPLLLPISLIILLLGFFVGRKEGWSPLNSFYWAFITAFTVGYGDYRPSRPATKLLSLVVTLFGFMLTGILVAITVNAATIAFKKQLAEQYPEQLKQIELYQSGAKSPYQQEEQQ